ncbi:hypothetical protein SASPL_104923 [Salvia splendens]|uniref:Uncharacterized protein n=1 Tax=Salvia splendens TaxID=180675 RepID=A0A8X8YKT2_SALSN|nr:hypothetical protein SASPL_104923 [Salvia splendens]
MSPAVLRLSEVTFSGDAPLRERIFRFSGESIQKLKSVVINAELGAGIDIAELMGKQSNDKLIIAAKSVEISLFQSLIRLILFDRVCGLRPKVSQRVTGFEPVTSRSPQLRAANCAATRW